MNLIDRAKAIAHGAEFLLRDWLGTGARAVPATHAQVRANTCLAGDNGRPCAENRKGSMLVGAGAATIKQIGRLKNKMQMRVIGEKSLHTCSICQCALKLKVWIPIDQLYEEMSDDEFDRLPHFCWVKTEINEMPSPKTLEEIATDTP